MTTLNNYSLNTEQKKYAGVMAEGAKKYESGRRALVNSLIDTGWCGMEFEKDFLSSCGKEDAAQIKETTRFIKVTIAKGVLGKQELALYLTDAKSVTDPELKVLRNGYGNTINGYFGSFKKMMRTAYYKQNPDAEKPEATKKEKAEAEGSGLPEVGEVSAKTLTLDGLQKIVITLTLEVSASTHPDIVAVRAQLIAALNALEAAAKPA
jgi:hypothetical protein